MPPNPLVSACNHICERILLITEPEELQFISRDMQISKSDIKILAPPSQILATPLLPLMAVDTDNRHVLSGNVSAFERTTKTYILVPGTRVLLRRIG